MNYDSQLKAWAIDRAIETLKIQASGPLTGEQVIALADVYAGYTANPEEPATDESVQ